MRNGEKRIIETTNNILESFFDGRYGNNDTKRYESSETASGRKSRDYLKNADDKEVKVCKSPELLKQVKEEEVPQRVFRRCDVV